MRPKLGIKLVSVMPSANHRHHQSNGEKLKVVNRRLQDKEIEQEGRETYQKGGF